MKVGLRQAPDGVVIYREKWGLIAAALIVSGLMIGFSAFMYSVWPQDSVGSLFLISFCLIFGGFGLALLLRLPFDARRWFADDGAILLRADAAGLTLAPLAGSRPQHFPWAKVEEIALAGTLKSIDRSETGYSWNALIVFFTPERHKNASWFDLAKAGLGCSGEGRVLMVVSYPRKRAGETVEALRAVAPGRVNPRHFCRIVFDHKTRRDAYRPV